MDLVRLAAGLCELAAPRRVAALEIGMTPEPHEVVIARVLGIRQVGQAAVSIITARFRVTGAVVDIAHAASMIMLAVLGPTRTRRAAIIQTAIAGSFAAAGFLAARRR